MPPHCDSMDGPVVTVARQALDGNDVDLVLPYVPAASEDEVRAAFADATEARALGGSAAKVADRLFFETVVRVHRSGEGAPYTGLKPAGLDEGPAIPLAEKAIEAGSIDELYDFLAAELRDQLKHRLDRVGALRGHSGESLPAAREYVGAMLGFEVYSHGLYTAMQAQEHGGGNHHG